MSEHSGGTFSALLSRAREGDASAVGALFSLTYDQLHAIASAQRRRRNEETLNTTALVHEAFLKLAGNEKLGLHDRTHFLAVAATAMRHVLLDRARSRLAAKRGGGRVAISFDEIEAALGSGSDFTETKAEALVVLGDSLTRLAHRSERQSRVVDCRFFAGLSIEETAQALGMSTATVKRDWAMAQAWLYHDLKESLG
jgi:RNA polymerase sigma factor (TIGR02999 family)